MELLCVKFPLFNVRKENGTKTSFTCFIFAEINTAMYHGMVMVGA